MELGERAKGKENDSPSVISHNKRCESRGYDNVYRKLLKTGVGGKGEREINRKGLNGPK
jgi:hypothetical protein